MPHNPSLPTPSNPTASGTTYHASTLIAAPASLVWNSVLEFSSYPHWNTFSPRITLPNPPPSPPRPLRVGDAGDLDATIASADAAPHLTKVVVSVIDVPVKGEEETIGAVWRLCWKAQGFPTWSLRPERVHEVEVLEGGRCEFRTWETMAGPLAGVIRRTMGGGLDAAFGRCAEGLKEWVEGGRGRNGGGNEKEEEQGKEEEQTEGGEEVRAER